MASKIQGEGDYKSAREYNDQTREFVKAKQKAGEKLEGNAAEASDELTAAEREALSHAKHGEQDARDAKLLRDSEAKR